MRQLRQFAVAFLAERRTGDDQQPARAAVVNRAAGDVVLRRATVVGETTGGGANPGDVFPVSPGFDIFVPTGYVEGVTTHKNWEGVGVQPDILVPADQALAKAYELALKGIAPANPRASAALADIDAALRSSVQF